ISDQARERLRSLGYVAAPAGTTTSTEAPNPEAFIADWNAFEQSLTSPVGAVATLARLARAHPAGAVFPATFARALNDSVASTAALAIYRDAVKRWPSDATLYHDLAVAARTAATRATGGTVRVLRDEARRAELATTALVPDHAAAHNGLGLLAIDDANPADAVAEFQRAVAAHPANASYRSHLGHA